MMKKKENTATEILRSVLKNQRVLTETLFVSLITNVLLALKTFI